MRRSRFLRRRAELFVLWVASSALHRRPAAEGAFVASPRGTVLAAFRGLRPGTRMETKPIDDADDFADFASFNDDDGRRLAREFSREVEIRRSQPSPELVAEEDDDQGDYDAKGEEGGRRAVRLTIRANSPDSPPNESSDEPPPSFPPIPFFPFQAPPPRPDSSAGLFSGSGATVYSSGRAAPSKPADVEMLEKIIKSDEKDRRLWEWYDVGNQDRAEALRAVYALALSLFLASAMFIAVEEAFAMVAVISGDASVNKVVSMLNDITSEGVSNIMTRPSVLTWDEASAPADRLVGLLGDATKDGISSVVTSTGAISWDEAVASADYMLGLLGDAAKDGMSNMMVSATSNEAFLGEEAAWLMKEASGLAAHVAENLLSVEEVVLL